MEAMLMVGLYGQKRVFQYGVANSITPLYVRKAKIVIAEVNKSSSCCLGGNLETPYISQIDYLVEGDNSL